VSGLTAERNVLRYLPARVHVRLAEGASPIALLRVLGAASLTGAVVTVSSAADLPAPVRPWLDDVHMPLTVEDDASWLAGLSTASHDRVRLIGAPASTVAGATDGRPDLAVHDHDVTEAGRIELLPFMKEQAVSITAHRFGTPNHLTDELI
jgi:RHH-type proline utilization regulon transcriptional repressor/proline dehydrogenase/delta 1-pyrroline-5-carboxylate dehydrogenase